MKKVLYWLSFIQLFFLSPSAMNPSAAFSVRLHEDTVLSDSPLVYETVDLNIGDGYDEFTGLLKFQAVQ